MQAVVWTAAEWRTICRTLEFWVEYGDVYRSHFKIYDDDYVVDVLRYNRHKEEVVKFFDWLQEESNMTRRADRMLRRMILLSLNPATL